MLKNPQHEQFCHEFLVDFNASAACERAKFSAKSARSQGSRLMENEEIRERIKELHAEMLSKVDSEPAHLVQRLVLELKRLAYCDLKDAINPIDGTLLPIDEIPEDVRRCIGSFEVKELWEGKEGQRVQIGVVKVIKWWDKNKAIELLGRHWKAFTDRVEHDVSDTLEALITGSMAKGEEHGSSHPVSTGGDGRRDSGGRKRGK